MALMVTFAHLQLAHLANFIWLELGTIVARTTRLVARRAFDVYNHTPAQPERNQIDRECDEREGRKCVRILQWNWRAARC